MMYVGLVLSWTQSCVGLFQELPRRLTIIASNFKKAVSDCLQSSTSLGLLATGGPGESDSALPQHRFEGKQRSGGVAGAARWRGGDFSVG